MENDLEEGEHGSRPVPDPTKLTTAALYREIAKLQELMQDKIDSLKTLHNSKFDADREAINLRRLSVDSALTEIRTNFAAQQLSATEAIRHSEGTTKELFVGLNTLINSKTEGLDGKINLINGRLDKGEGVGSGHDKDRATTFATMGIAVAVTSLVITIGVALFTIFGTHTAPQPQIVVQPPTSISAPAK